jgi:hypothetical protein
MERGEMGQEGRRLESRTFVYSIESPAKPVGMVIRQTDAEAKGI